MLLINTLTLTLNFHGGCVANPRPSARIKTGRVAQEITDAADATARYRSWNATRPGFRFRVTWLQTMRVCEKTPHEKRSMTNPINIYRKCVLLFVLTDCMLSSRLHTTASKDYQWRLPSTPSPTQPPPKKCQTLSCLTAVLWKYQVLSLIHI